MSSNSRRNSYGFTLVELLVVIAIVSVLAGALFMVINPSRLQTKSREFVLKTNTAKLCAALFSCASVKSVATDCSTGDFTKLGVVAPVDPVGASYSITSSDPITIRGALGSCIYDCSFSFSDGVAKNLPSSPPAGCQP